MKQYSFLIEAGELSVQIMNHFKRMRPYTRMSPQMFDQVEKAARKNAANEIKRFKTLKLKRNEWKRQLNSFEDKMHKFSKNHNLGYN